MDRDSTPEGGDLLYTAWTIIANAGGGDWKTQTPEWQAAAAAWRDRFQAALAAEPVPGRERLQKGTTPDDV